MEHFLKNIIRVSSSKGGTGEVGAGPGMGDVLEVLARLILAVIFIYAAVSKIADPGLFLIQLRSYQLVPDPFAAWLAMGLPWLELFVGISLLTGLAYRGAVVILTGMLLVFLGAIISAWLRDLEIDCGCFGVSNKEGAYGTLIIRDLAMLAGSMLLLWRLRQGHSLKKSSNSLED